jgi:hypothetical protein
MKKVIYSFIVWLYFMTTVQAQCPISITMVAAGNSYNLFLANLGQCSNFPLGSIKTINGTNYGVAACDDDSGLPIVELTVQGGSVPVPITAAPITIGTFPGSPCVYNALGVLPIQLLSFEGKALEKSNLLTWRTASETQNKGFDIERSADGSRFEKIGFVAGNGTTSQTQRYTFEDNITKSPLWGFRGYYRLKQLDEDGRFEYSKIVAIAQKGDNAVSVFPNPSNGVFTLSGLENIEDEQISIVNSIGQNIAISVQNDGQMDLSAYPSGVYYLRIASSGQVVKLIHQ